MKTLAFSLTLCTTLACLGSTAFAGDNDLVLSRFSEFNPKEFEDTSKNQICTLACGQVKPDQQSFENLVSDLGEVFAPRFANPAETLGEAGFAFSLMTSISTIPYQQPYWQTGVEDRDPPSTLTTGHVQIRKGLPFSLELVGNMSYLFESEMFTMGADVKAALLEGFYYLPNVAARGTVNTLLGADELNLITTGWDISISKDFGIGGVMSLSPYLGYQQLFIIGSSRLLNAYPQDPRPPQFDPDDPTRRFSPEFVFSQYNGQVNRFFLGARLNVWIMSFILEGVVGQNVNQFTFSTGVDF